MTFDVKAARRLGESESRWYPQPDVLLAACDEIERLQEEAARLRENYDLLGKECNDRTDEIDRLRESMRVLVEESSRWEKAYTRTCDLLAEAVEALERLKTEGERKPGAPIMRYHQSINDTLTRLEIEHG